VVLGDSLVAGYQLDAADAFPERLEAALLARGHAVEVVNAGVSGDTATAGLARVDWSVDPDADAVIVELGANDMLRGLDPAITRDALDRLLTRLGERRLPVLVAGMRAAPNLGTEYERDFNAIYPELAAAHGALLYPFLLDGVVAVDPKLLLADGLHPSPAGVTVMVERILPLAEELVARAMAAGQ
jgi:acyl-CoA thioesterase-1